MARPVEARHGANGSEQRFRGLIPGTCIGIGGAALVYAFYYL